MKQAQLKALATHTHKYDLEVKISTFTYIHTLLARPHGAFQSQFYITKL